MKITNLFLALGLLVMIGCSKSDDTANQMNNAEFQAFKTEVQSSDEFFAYQESNNAFFAKIRNHEYDFFAVYEFIKSSGITFDCSEDAPSTLLHLDGVDTYWNSRCKTYSNLITLTNTFPKLKSLSRENKILTFIEDSTTFTRATDCLSDFQYQWMGATLLDEIEEMGYPRPDEMTHDTAVSNYEDCCKDNSDDPGCP